jgi:hypothetical protein
MNGRFVVFGHAYLPVWHVSVSEHWSISALRKNIHTHQVPTNYIQSIAWHGMAWYITAVASDRIQGRPYTCYLPLHLGFSWPLRVPSLYGIHSTAERPDQWFDWIRVRMGSSLCWYWTCIILEMASTAGAQRWALRGETERILYFEHCNTASEILLSPHTPSMSNSFRNLSA